MAAPERGFFALGLLLEVSDLLGLLLNATLGAVELFLLLTLALFLGALTPQRTIADEASLDERERRVLRLRFEENLNQYEIGRRLGVSQMQVSRIMRRALRKLLRAVQGNGSPRSKAA